MKNQWLHNEEKIDDEYLNIKHVVEIEIFGPMERRTFGISERGADTTKIQLSVSV